MMIINLSTFIPRIRDVIWRFKIIQKYLLYNVNYRCPCSVKAKAGWYVKRLTHIGMITYNVFYITIRASILLSFKIKPIKEEMLTRKITLLKPFVPKNLRTCIGIVWNYGNICRSTMMIIWQYFTLYETMKICGMIRVLR